MMNSDEIVRMTVAVDQAIATIREQSALITQLRRQCNRQAEMIMALETRQQELLRTLQRMEVETCTQNRSIS